MNMIMFFVFIGTSVADTDCCCVWSAEKVTITNTTCSKGCPVGVPCFERKIDFCCTGNGVCLGKPATDYICAASDSKNVTVDQQVPCI